MRSKNSFRAGVSLMEVILAIGILGGSMAALSSIVMTGANAAIDAKERALAQLLCEQQMAQLVMNNVTPVPVIDQPLPTTDSAVQYSMSVQTQQTALNGVLAIQVAVTSTSVDGSRSPLTVSLMRWMVDPLLGLEKLEAEEKAALEEAAMGDSMGEDAMPSGESGAGL